MILEALAVIVLGVAAGAVAGLFGVGGGVIFVPTLTLVIGLGQLEAEATSLLAIIPVALLGAWRQYGYGNVRLSQGLLIGALSVPGVALGSVLANNVSERSLELSFAALQVFFAVGLARRALARNRV